jgi:uncharacterized caspase-like protein
VQINKIVLSFALVLVWLISAAGVGANAAEPVPASRVALVIGNSRYEPAIGALRNPVNDARTMAKTLRALRFTVLEKHNLNRDELLAAMVQFRARLRGAEVGVFYFAGHGISVNGSNYLVPIKSGYSPDAPSAADRRLLAETKLFNAEEAVADMTQAGAGCNLVILDACRGTPIARNPQIRDASAAGGLAEMNPPAGSLIAFATDAGHTAADGVGANSIYTQELVKHLLTPGLTIEQVFKRTRAGVMERSGGSQMPAEYSRLVGEDIFLAGQTPTKPAELVKSTEPGKAGEGPKPSESTNPLTPTSTPPQATRPVPTLAEINRLANAGDAAACIEALHTAVLSHGPNAHFAVPLATLLERVKVSLRDPVTAAGNAPEALQTCQLVLSALTDYLPAQHPGRTILSAKAWNRQGDALLLLHRPQEALASFNSAAELDSSDGYVLYNRGRAYLALDRKEEARVDFTAAAGAKFKKSRVHELAMEALTELK